MTYVYTAHHKYTPDAELLILMDDVSNALKLQNRTEKAEKLKAVKAEITTYDEEKGASMFGSVAGVLGLVSVVAGAACLFAFSAPIAFFSLLGVGLLGLCMNPSLQSYEISEDAKKMTTAIDRLIEGSSSAFEQDVTTAFNAKSFNKLQNALKKDAKVKSPEMSP